MAEQQDDWCEAALRELGLTPVQSEAADVIHRHAAPLLARAEAEAARLRTACQRTLDELDGRYDGAPDSPTRWMGEHVDRLTAALAEGGK